MDRYLIAKKLHGLLKVEQPSSEELAKYGYGLSEAQVEALGGRAGKVFSIVERDYPQASVEEQIKRTADLMHVLSSWSDERLADAIKRQVSCAELSRGSSSSSWMPTNR